MTSGQSPPIGAAQHHHTLPRVSKVPEQASLGSKIDENTASTDEFTSEVVINSSTPEKRKRETRRFSRFFRATSPTKKSPSKKARRERRRSTGDNNNDTAATYRATNNAVSRSLPFLRRNASFLGNEHDHHHQPTTTTTISEQNAFTVRRRSLFRRNRTHKPTSPKQEIPWSDDKQDHLPLIDDSLQQQTHVITVRNKARSPAKEEEKKEQESSTTDSSGERKVSDSFLCQSTEIFQHSYLETLCGNCGQYDNDSSVNNLTNRHLPEDPTVQESIECVFSSRLEEDIARMLQLDHNDYDEDQYMSDILPMAPSQFHQSVLRTRSDLSSPPVRKRVESVKLAHLGSFRQGVELTSSSGSSNANADVSMDAVAPTEEPPKMVSPVCACQCSKVPPLDPSSWPQSPLLLRPTPGSGTRVKRVRLVGSGQDEESSTILWESGQESETTWLQALHKYWGKKEKYSPDVATSECQMCPECMVLPINNGNESKGESLVTDFESDLFEGTLLIRLRYSNGTTREPYQDDRGYFTGMNRRYQTVIRGRFKEPMSWTDCRTGFVLDRPAGKLPAKWILKGGIKVLSFFAPHLEVKFDGPRPTSLTPLGSTPQVLAVHNRDEPYNMEMAQEEPKTNENTLLGEASPALSSLQRARLRKKSFDKLYAHRAIEPKTDPSKVYTFEFLQHLFNFQDFSIELGSMLGSVPLAPILDGQALPIMACHASYDRRLWSFDVWHESLVSSKLK